MKKLLLFAFILIGLTNVNAQGVWVSQATNFTPVSSGVRHISTVDSNIVWICSYDGSGGAANRQDFSRTIDGGTTWVAGTITGAPVTHDWAMIYGLNADTAWSVLYSTSTAVAGGIYKTTDGGATWTQQGAGVIYNNLSQSFPNVVHFWDANNGFAMGDPEGGFYELYTTTDGEATGPAYRQVTFLLLQPVNMVLLDTMKCKETPFGLTPTKDVYTALWIAD
jgi:hypothetical protein